MQTTITVESPIVESPRVSQIRGIFDLASEKILALAVDGFAAARRTPLEHRSHRGPSGCGKTTIARHFWPDRIHRDFTWPSDAALLDGFPGASVDQGRDGSAIGGRLLVAAGVAAAVSRPLHRPAIPRHARPSPRRSAATLAVMDEYTSVVDRTVAQIGSAALAKVVRQRGQRFVAVTCHDDVEPWLQPDWVYRPGGERLHLEVSSATAAASRLAVVRCQTSAWPLFAAHHYLSGNLRQRRLLPRRLGRPAGRVQRLAAVRRRRAADAPRASHRDAARLSGRRHRQCAVGAIASLWKALGYRAVSTTTHPAMMRARQKSPLWRLHRPPSLAAGSERTFEETPARHDAADRRLRVHRSRPAAPPGPSAAGFVSCPAWLARAIV